MSVSVSPSQVSYFAGPPRGANPSAGSPSGSVFKVFTRLQLCVKRQEPELAERPREGTNSQLNRSFLTRLHLIYPSQLSIER